MLLPESYIEETVTQRHLSNLSKGTQVAMGRTCIQTKFFLDPNLFEVYLSASQMNFGGGKIKRTQMYPQMSEVNVRCLKTKSGSDSCVAWRMSLKCLEHVQDKARRNQKMKIANDKCHAPQFPFQLII